MKIDPFFIVIAFLMLVIVVLPYLCDYVRLQYTRVELRTVGALLEQARIAQSEDLIGQVSDLNRTIARARYWNSIPVITLWVPDGWEKLEPLTIP